MANENNNQSVRTYTKQFAKLISTVYENQAYFSDFYPLSTMDGITNNATAFSLKVNNTPVTINDYDTTATKAMGTGTGSGSRFGARTEVIYSDVDVPYSWDYAIHEGIDRHTVNLGLDDAVADRLDLQAQAKVIKFDSKDTAHFSTNAGKNVTASVADIETMTTAEITKIFDQVSAWFVDNRVNRNLTKIAKVRSQVYNAIVNNNLSTTAKGSDVNIDRNEVQMFKGFVIEEVPADLFQTDEYAYISVPGVAQAFTGIETARTIESEDFDGVALQGAGKSGEYVIEDNKKAMVKVTITVTGA